MIRKTRSRHRLTLVAHQRALFPLRDHLCENGTVYRRLLRNEASGVPVKQPMTCGYVSVTT